MYNSNTRKQAIHETEPKPNRTEKILFKIDISHNKLNNNYSQKCGHCGKQKNSKWKFHFHSAQCGVESNYWVVSSLAINYRHYGVNISSPRKRKNPPKRCLRDHDLFAGGRNSFLHLLCEKLWP